MNSIVGPIKSPFTSLNANWGNLCNQGTGPLTLLGFIIRGITVVAGLWALINILVAGLTFISSEGEPDKIKLAWAKINLSFIGLIIIVSTYAIAWIIGNMLFDNPNFIFSPPITGAGNCPT